MDATPDNRIAEALARLEGAVLARLDDGSERMSRIDGKLDRVMDAAEVVTKQLADHEARIRGLEEGRRANTEWIRTWGAWVLGILGLTGIGWRLWRP